MNRPTQIPETAVALDSRETSFSAPPTDLDRDIAQQPASTLRPTMEFEWDDFDTGTLDELAYARQG